MKKQVVIVKKTTITAFVVEIDEDRNELVWMMSAFEQIGQGDAPSAPPLELSTMEFTDAPKEVIDEIVELAGNDDPPDWLKGIVL